MKSKIALCMRVLFTATGLVLFGALLYRNYCVDIDFNPFGWKWYLANSIFQFLLWGSFFTFILWGLRKERG